MNFGGLNLTLHEGEHSEIIHNKAFRISSSVTIKNSSYLRSFL